MATNKKKAFVPAKDFLARFTPAELASIKARAEALVAEEKAAAPSTPVQQAPKGRQ